MTQPSDSASQSLSLLREWLGARLSEDALDWLDEKRAAVSADAEGRAFFLAFSAVPRHTGKADLALTEDEEQAVAAAREGWQPGAWSVDQAGRTLLALALSGGIEPDAYVRTLDRASTHADAGEAVALHQSLPLLPYPERHRARAVEGLRTNMTSVFEAVALRNPYPAEQFDQDAWNQMVLKAIFVGSPLHRMYGLDRRANATLARMLVDYAHERWAAGRNVTPELWRPVGPFAEGTVVDDLEDVLASDDPVQREAAALALAQSPSDRAHAILEGGAPELQAAADEGELTWDHLVRERLNGTP